MVYYWYLYKTINLNQNVVKKMEAISDWDSFLVYPNLFEIKGFVVVVVCCLLLHFMKGKSCYSTDDIACAV
jgi:hypothetical protein